MLSKSLAIAFRCGQRMKKPVHISHARFSTSKRGPSTPAQPNRTAKKHRPNRANPSPDPSRDPPPARNRNRGLGKEGPELGHGTQAGEAGGLVHQDPQLPQDPPAESPGFPEPQVDRLAGRVVGTCIYDRFMYIIYIYIYVCVSTLSYTHSKVGVKAKTCTQKEST